MANGRSLGAHLFDQWTFLRAFLRHPRQIASITPSSRFLERRVVAAAGLAGAKSIVELGPGNGGVTRAVLRAASAQAQLLAIELDPRLHALVRGIDDRRLIAHLGDAGQLRAALARYGLEAPDVVISGIPFSTMSVPAGAHILAEIAALLAPGGRFVAYQLSPRVAILGRPLLGAERSELELLNLPPMRIYRWQKPGRATGAR